MKLVDITKLLQAFAWARLGVAALLLALAPALPDELMPAANRSILALTLLVVVLSSGGLLVWSPGARPHRIAWLVCLLDTALATAVVAATGGAVSIFTFLYVLSVTASCVLLSRTGGLAIAAASSVLYSGLVFGHTIVPVTAFFEAPQETTALEVLTMFLNCGMFLVIAIVAGGLAERFQVTRDELETKRKDLRDLEAFKDLVFHSVSTGLIALDRDHRVTAFNRAAEEMTGLPARQAIGQPWRTLFGGAVPLGEVEAAIAEGGWPTVRHETTLPRPYGAPVPVRVTFSALRAGDGGRVGLIGVCEDLSALREMEARMRAADRLASLGRLAANIAHEIRNPLASLTGAIEVLAASGVAPDTRDRLAQIVLKESGRLNEIITDFLDYARPAPLARRPVNIAEALDEVLVLLEHRAQPGTIKIVRELSPSLVWDVDPQQFRQAIWNLCLNAFQAMPDGGELRVGAAVHRGRLEIRIADSGEGIAAADLPHIFEPFFSTKSDGSGLGLALVHRVVQDHGGDVVVHSLPGAGAAFTLTLPALHG